MKATNVRAFRVLTIPLVAGIVAALILAFGFGGAERAVAQVADDNGTGGKTIFVLSGTLDVNPLPNPCQLTGEFSVQTGQVFGVEVNDLYFDSLPITGSGLIIVECPPIDPQEIPITGVGNCTETVGNTEATDFAVDPPFDCTLMMTVGLQCQSLGDPPGTGEACNVDLEWTCSDIQDPTQVFCVVSSASDVVGKDTGSVLQIKGGSVALTSNGGGIVPTPIGGVGSFPDAEGSAPFETPASSGSNAGLLAGVIAAATVGAITVTGAVWYARRRWLA